MASRRTALITGAGRNIGRACVLGLAEDGFDVVLNGSSDRAACEGVAAEAEKLGAKTLVLMRNGVPTQMTFDTFAERSGRPGTTHNEEKIHDPLIRIDNDLAVVWAPFDYFIDGKVDHCGTDLFNLVRKDGKWLIASVADTGRKDCAAK